MIRVVVRPGQCHILGLSTETKPINPPNGFVFTESDTYDNYIALGGAWVLVHPKAFPIDFIYFSHVNVNPAVILGYGTWIFIGQTNLPILGAPPSSYQPFLFRRTV